MGDATNYETEIKRPEGWSHTSVLLVHAASNYGACPDEHGCPDVVTTSSKKTALNQHVGDAAPIGVINK